MCNGSCCLILGSFLRSACVILAHNKYTQVSCFFLKRGLNIRCTFCIYILVIFVFIFIINHCLWLTGRPETTEFLNPLFWFLCFCFWTADYETWGFHCILINHRRCQCFLKCKYLCKWCVWVLFPLILITSGPVTWFVYYCGLFNNLDTKQE